MPPPPPPPHSGGLSIRTAGSGAAGTRAVILGLAFAVGLAAWAGRGIAQTTPNPARWVTPSHANWANFSVDTENLLGSTTQQQVTARYGPGVNWFSAGIQACEWTAVTPGATGATGTCHTLKEERTGGGSAITRTVNITLTATMITNGGVVIKIS